MCLDRLQRLTTCTHQTLMGPIQVNSFDPRAVRTTPGSGSRESRIAPDAANRSPLEYFKPLTGAEPRTEPGCFFLPVVVPPSAAENPATSGGGRARIYRRRY